MKRLKNAGKLLQENKKEEFYEEVLRALWGYLSDKLNIPQAELTKDNVEVELSKYGVDETLLVKLRHRDLRQWTNYMPRQLMQLVRWKIPLKSNEDENKIIY